MHHQKLFQFGRTGRLRAIIAAAAGSKRQAVDKLKDDERRRLRDEVVALRGGEK